MPEDRKIGHLIFKLVKIISTWSTWTTVDCVYLDIHVHYYNYWNLIVAFDKKKRRLYTYTYRTREKYKYEGIPARKRRNKKRKKIDPFWIEGMARNFEGVVRQKRFLLLTPRHTPKTSPPKRPLFLAAVTWPRCLIDQKIGQEKSASIQFKTKRCTLIIWQKEQKNIFSSPIVSRSCSYWHFLDPSNEW